jgi:hypothetical protein
MKQNETNLGEKGEKGETVFHCIYCDYKCCVKFSYERHLTTTKHINKSQMKQKETNETNKEKKEKKEKNACNCGLVYYSRTSLWRHKKTCDIVNNVELKGQNDEKKDELINYLIKENKEFKNLILEILKKDTMNNCNNNTTINTNSHNKTFNLNLFLNETCKDALNISDFVSSIKVSLTDLENTGRQGYIEGISSIILKHLNNLEQYQRPIHCSDFKREVIYIKDNDKWEKECEEKPLLTKAIKVIANENIKKIMEWRETNPDCTNSESKKNNLYLKIVSNSMNGSDKEEGIKNITKIISNVAKETQIQKEN